LAKTTAGCAEVGRGVQSCATDSRKQGLVAQRAAVERESRPRFSGVGCDLLLLCSASGASWSNPVGVQIPASAPTISNRNDGVFGASRGRESRVANPLG